MCIWGYFSKQIHDGICLQGFVYDVELYDFVNYWVIFSQFQQQIFQLKVLILFSLTISQLLGLNYMKKQMNKFQFPSFEKCVKG